MYILFGGIYRLWNGIYRFWNGFTDFGTGLTDSDKWSYDRSGPLQSSGNDVFSLIIDTPGVQLPNASRFLKKH